MRAFTLLRIEWLKASRRKAFWVALGFLAVLTGIMVIGELVQGRGGFGAPFAPPYTWAMAAEVFGPVPGFFLALTVVMLVTSEFGWRTARQNVIDGLAKEQFFAAKALMLLMALGIFMLVPFSIATGVSLYGRAYGATAAAAAASPAAESAATQPASERAAQEPGLMQDTAQAVAGSPPVQDTSRTAAAQRVDSAQASLREAMRALREQQPRPVYAAPDPDAALISLDELKVFGAFALGSLGFASMAFMLAMVLRSTGGAIGVFFLYFAFLEQTILLMLRRFVDPELAQTVAPYMPVRAVLAPLSPQAWHPGHVERISAIQTSIGGPPLIVDPDPLRLLGLPLLWIAVFLGVAFLDFRRRDL